MKGLPLAVQPTSGQQERKRCLAESRGLPPPNSEEGGKFMLICLEKEFGAERTTAVISHSKKCTLKACIQVLHLILPGKAPSIPAGFGGRFVSTKVLETLEKILLPSH